jgi:prepilin-type N-terminal cleavage/methylation domain-containing protein
MTRTRSGFTIVELLVAIVILSVGLLAMVGTSSMTTRTLGKSRRVDFGAAFAGRRLEMLRANACANAAARTNGQDSLKRGNTVYAVNIWSWTNAGLSTYRLNMKTAYLTEPGARGSATLKIDTLRTDTAISCLL